MHSIKTLAAFCSTLMLSSCFWGGWYDDGYSQGSNYSFNPGDVTISWSLAGADCRAHPEIANIVVTIPGESLQNNGYYPCTINGYPGVTLHDFAGGDYSYTVEAIDRSGRTLFAGDSSFRIDGTTRTSIDLTPVGGPSSYAYVSWTFPSNAVSDLPNCRQAGVAGVYISYDDGAPLLVDCQTGFEASPGVQTPYLQPGVHFIEIVAVDSRGYSLYGIQSTLTTSAYKPVSADYALGYIQ